MTQQKVSLEEGRRIIDDFKRSKKFFENLVNTQGKEGRIIGFKRHSEKIGGTK